MRRFIALAVIALHGVLLLLCISGKRVPVLTESEDLYFVSLWIPLDQPPKPAAEPPAPLRKPPTPVKIETKPPSKSITTNPPATTTGTETTQVSSLDWAREATLAAQRESGPNPDVRKDFSPAPKPIAKPCIPKKSSMEWNGKEDRRVGFASGLPFVRLGKRCVVGLGFFGCNPGALPEVNGHLLDDMRDPDRTISSVPDPNVCD